jgi:hypothetical protein
VKEKSYLLRVRPMSYPWPKSYFGTTSITHQNHIPGMSESKISFKIVTQIKAHHIPRECQLRAKAVRAKAVRVKAVRAKAKCHVRGECKISCHHVCIVSVK